MSLMGGTALGCSEEQGMLLDVAREFCRERSPIAAVRGLLESETGYDESVWRDMAELGWAGIALPEAVGGAGLGMAGAVPVFEALGTSLLGTPLLATTLAGQLLSRIDAERFHEVLSEIAAGSPATVALLDDEDWHAPLSQCLISDEGVLSGRKCQVLDLRAASWVVVVARHGDQPAVAVLRAEQLAEAAVEDHVLIDLTRRAATVDVTGVKVEQTLWASGERVAEALRDWHLLGALLVAAEAVGSTRACLDTIVDYLKTRKQFGRLIGSYQALKHPSVEILQALELARSLVWHAATLLPDTATLDRDAEIACRMAKAEATEALLFAGDRAVQFHGGMGFTWECDAQLYIRRAQWSQQQFGDAMHHRRRLAALMLDG